MDKFRLELEQTCIEEEDARADIEFYETIEAPTFVDFTRPNHFCPDDRFWFCSRVGCNRKHEEEMNPEAIYKDFVLRVMAARSPNVRFQRALTRKPPSDSKKCPMSAPPKPSKSRIPRLALVSSISKKLIDDRGKGTHIPASAKPVYTPKARVKSVPAKYMTSPRKKKGGSPNLKAFQSVRNPKKTSITIQKNRAVAKALLFSSPKKAVKFKTSELNTPVTKLCDGVKKLALTSVKKDSVQKHYKESTSVRKLLPSKFVAFKAKQHDKKHDDSASHHEERSGDDSSDMEIDEKSRDGSLDLCTETAKSGSEEKHGGISNDNDSKTFRKKPTSSSERPLTAGSLTNELTSVPSSEQRCSDQQNVVEIQDLNPTVQSKGKKSCTTEDDKENALNTDYIRNVNGNNLSKHDAPVKSKVKKIQKIQNGNTALEDDCHAVVTQGVKYKKLKPTNPKPFRLRTDERGILKEANLERKANFHETSTTTSENSQNVENGVSAITAKVSKKVEDKTLKKVRFISVKSKYKKTSKEAEPLSLLCAENRTGRTKSSFLHKEIIRPQRKNESQVKPKGVTLTEETATTTSTPKELTHERKDISVKTNKGSTHHRLASQKRKPTTVAREPKFHTLNTPKSCTRNMQ